jgi:hypothetical protein
VRDEDAQDRLRRRLAAGTLGLATQHCRREEQLAVEAQPVFPEPATLLADASLRVTASVQKLENRAFSRVVESRRCWPACQAGTPPDKPSTPSALGTVAAAYFPLPADFATSFWKSFHCRR